jgi:phosphatidylserine/phosphatidylglycerophosphate/cardiolipin synthase-like enzyme
MNDPGSWLTVGSLLLRAPDPVLAARTVHAYLLNPSADLRSALDADGISSQLLDDFRSSLPNDSDSLLRVCDLGAAWAAGRQSVPASDMWEPVVTGPQMDPLTFERLTAETLISLIVAAEQRIRLFTPFVDARGIEPLAFALAAATKRNVDVFVGYRAQADRTHAIDGLLAALDTHGEPRRCTLIPFSGEQFPHLKLLIVDSARAYIGSANLTYAALTTNYEVGALVSGESVRVYEALLDEVLGDS